MHGRAAAPRVSPGPGVPPSTDMAAGVIQPLAELRLPSPFPHGLLLPTHAEPDFHDLSEEEEDEEEEEEEAEATEESARLELTTSSTAETTLRLLKFSELISCDIQRYFGRRGRDEAATTTTTSSTTTHTVPKDCGSPRSAGAQPEAPGATHRLGPLAELFEYGVHRCLSPRAAGGRTQRLARKYGHITPMHHRKLPPSFWKEPGPASLLHAGTPDFSDLLANWTVEPGPEPPCAGRELPLEPGRPGMEAEPFAGL